MQKPKLKARHTPCWGNGMSEASFSNNKLHDLILNIRNQRVMIDSDLAKIYGVTTKRLNEQVKRNKNRFPADFMFQLTIGEKNEVVANCDHLKNSKFSNTLPYVFTEHGALMLASVLSSPTAVAASIEVVRAFVRAREWLNLNTDLASKFGQIEQKFIEHDQKLKVIFDAVRQIMNPSQLPKRPIGIKTKG